MESELTTKKQYLRLRWEPAYAAARRDAQRSLLLHQLSGVYSAIGVLGALVLYNRAGWVVLILLASVLLAQALDLSFGLRARGRAAQGTADALRSERELFEAGVGTYRNEETAFDYFVRRSEALILAGSKGDVPTMPTTTDKPVPRSGSRASSTSPGSRLEALRRRFGSSDNDDDETANDRSRINPFSLGNRSSSERGSPFGRPSGGSPFGGSPRFAGNRPIGSSGGVHSERDDPALAGLQNGNGSSGVRFSAYYPKELPPNVWFPLRAYVYMGFAAESVVQDANVKTSTKRQPEILYQRARQTHYHIPEGASVTVTPTMPGFQFNPAHVTVGFYRDWHRFDFELRAVDARMDEATNGTLTFSVDGLVVADVPLSVYVARNVDVNSNDIIRQVTRKPYRSVYVSFSPLDDHLAEPLRLVADALGMYALRDLIAARANGEWNDDLLKFIDSAEVFQLFWSQSAAESDEVAQEVQQALARATEVENFIRPVYWEQPLVTLPTGLQPYHATYLPDLGD